MAFPMPSGKDRGFSYLGVMIFIAIAGVALAGIGSLSSMQAKREKESQLLFVGDQFRRAIASYYLSTPEGVKQYPQKLDDLLEDHRFPQLRRHLRQIYADPVTNTRDWGIVEAGGRITGVYSLSERPPKKRSGFPALYQTFEEAKSYRDWKFVETGATKAESAVVVEGEKKSPAGTPASASEAADARTTGGEGDAGTASPSPPAVAPEPPAGNCSDQLAGDMVACKSACDRLQLRDCSFCQRSALVRNAACRAGRGMPALVTSP
jgi:type II secretory pathway pseudopilin PulG